VVHAVAAHAQGQYTTALALGQQALTLLEHAEGPHHPDVANVLTTLAGTQAAFCPPSPAASLLSPGLLPR